MEKKRRKPSPPPEPGGKGKPKDEPSYPTQALADRQTDPVPDTEREEQPVTAHQDRRHK
jgi:hypothetical protein